MSSPVPSSGLAPAAPPRPGSLRDLVAAPGPGGRAARRLLPFAVAGPVLLGGVILAAERAGLGAPAVGVASVVVAAGAAALTVALARALDGAWREARRHAEQAEETIRRQAELLDHLPVVVALKDLEGRYTFVNRTFEEVTRRERAVVIGRTPTDLVADGPFPPGFSPAEHLRRTLEQDAAVLAAGRATIFEEVAPRPDGERRFWVTRFPLRDAAGVPYGVASLSQDVTDRVRLAVAEEARRAEVAELREVQRMKDHLLSTLSHELKTPLALVVGYAELLEERFGEDPLLTGLQEGVWRLDGQVRRLVDLAALVGGSMPLARAPVDAAEIVEAVVAQLGPRAAAARVRLLPAVAPDLPQIDGDARRLVQLVAELADNGIRHAAAGGTVFLEAARGDGGDVILAVCDEGPGLDADALARAWEAFGQAEVGDARRHAGLGIGLTLARLLAERHGGRLEASSGTAGTCPTGAHAGHRGCCFRVELASVREGAGTRA